jgi:putative tryptophan/tyrosine transport system substrate-binding protein
MGSRFTSRLSSLFLLVAALSIGLAIPAAAESKAGLVGIAKFVSHPALDALEKGIMDEISAARPEIKFDLQNSNADMGTAAQIARRFKDEKPLVVVGIATPTAQALANAIKDIPVIFSAVTDPVSAGLVASLDKGGSNVTGTSDMTPVRGQLEFLLKVKSVKRLGHVYNAGEANSVKLAEMVKAFCAEKGIKLVEATVTNSSEVKTATLSIADRIDAIYLGNDNTVFSAINAVAEVAIQKKLPLVTADPSSAETGVPVLAAIGFDYYAMGRSTGKIVLRVLAGEKTADIPAYLSSDPKDFETVINKDTAAKIGLALPASILAGAQVIVEGGKATKK